MTPVWEQSSRDVSFENVYQMKKSVPVLRITKRIQSALASYYSYNTENPDWNKRFEFIVFKSRTLRLITSTRSGRIVLGGDCPRRRASLFSGSSSRFNSRSWNVISRIVRTEYVLTYRHYPVVVIVSAIIMHISCVTLHASLLSRQR